VGQDGILRGGWLPPLFGPITNRPQVTNLPHKLSAGWFGVCRLEARVSDLLMWRTVVLTVLIVTVALLAIITAARERR
jgi:hypothetical protein